MMIDIIYEDNHVLVALKKVNVLSQSDGSTTPDMLTLLKKYLKEKYHKEGNVYLGLVHRLDKEVGGIMVFAKTSKAAKRLSQNIQDHKFYKEYLAVVKGNLTSSATFKDYLKRIDYKSYVTNQKDGKEAILSYETLAANQDSTLVKINLKTGRHHQIRVQFATRHHPLLGDKKYGQKGKYPLALYAYKLSFYHPITKELLTFTSIPKEGYFKSYQKSLDIISVC